MSEKCWHLFHQLTNETNGEHYLLGRQFVVRTDHASLKYLWDQRICTTAQQKWLAKLVGYDFTIEYKPGRENRAANSLSRVNEYSRDNLKRACCNPEEAINLVGSSPVPNWFHK